MLLIVLCCSPMMTTCLVFKSLGTDTELLGLDCEAGGGVVAHPKGRAIGEL